MGIAQKHAYRFGFLKSDEWRDFRLVALVHYGERCYACKKDCSNPDIHHLWYPGRKMRVWDARPLCRECHNAAHEATSPKDYKDYERAVSEFYAFVEERMHLTPTAIRKIQEARDRREYRLNRKTANNGKTLLVPTSVIEKMRRDAARNRDFLRRYAVGKTEDNPRDKNLSQWVDSNYGDPAFEKAVLDATGVDLSVLTIKGEEV
jgi:hypothetical protein